MPDDADTSAAWRAAESQLASGWRLHSVRCETTAMDSFDEGSEHWIAVAVSTRETVVCGRGPDAVSALAALLEITPKVGGHL